MPIRSDFSFTDSLSSGHRQMFYEGYRSVALLMIPMVFLSPLAGLYVTGLFGAVLGVLLSFAVYYLDALCLAHHRAMTADLPDLRAGRE